MSRVFFGVHLCCKALFQSWWGRKLKIRRRAALGRRRCGLLETSAHSGRGKAAEKPIFSFSSSEGTRKTFQRDRHLWRVDPRIRGVRTKHASSRWRWDQCFIQSICVFPLFLARNMDSGTRWERTVGGRCNTRLECRGGFSSRKKLPGTLPNSPDLLGIGGRRLDLA